VDIRVGVPKPEAVDLEVIKAQAPVGKVSAEAVEGGLEVEMMGSRPSRWCNFPDGLRS
jgi:hypothetical protein